MSEIGDDYEAMYHIQDKGDPEKILSPNTYPSISHCTALYIHRA
jgi:hypothetical protein